MQKLNMKTWNKINVKIIAFGNETTHYRLENRTLGFIETLHKQ